MHFNKKILVAVAISFGLNIAANESFAKITYVLDQSVINSPIHDEIDSAMRHAVDTYNAYSDYNIEIPVYYNADVPTANAINNGRIVFGGSYSNKTAIHEMGHVMGIGTYGAWASLMGENSRYLGEHGIAMMKELEGDDATLYAGNIHFWPHGFNYNYEDAEKHIRLIGAMRKDMGLPDRTKVKAVTEAMPETTPETTATTTPETAPSTVNNKPSLPLPVDTAANTPAQPNDSGTQGAPTQTPSSQQPLTIKPVTKVPAYQTMLLETVQGKKVMDIAGNNNHDAVISNKSTGNTSQRWEKIPTDSGFFQLRNQASGLCLDVAGALKTLNNDALVQWSCHASHNQQWKETKAFNKFSVFSNRKSGRCIQRHNNNRANSTPFVQYSCSQKTMGQMFRVR